MFSINEFSKMNNIDLINISSGYEVIHFDEEPILFSGYNIYGNRILGSLIEKEGSNHSNYYFFSIVTPAQLSDFLHQKISYKSLLSSLKSMYVAKAHVLNAIDEAFLVNTEEIPSEYLPLDDSFCPPLEANSSYDFVVSLHGGMADDHEADPEEIVSLQQNIKNIFSNPAKIFNMDTPYKLAINAFAPGSFQIQYSLKLNNDDLFLNLKDDKGPLMLRYISQYIDYCINNFSEESDNIIQDDFENASRFVATFELAKKINSDVVFDSTKDDLSLRNELSKSILETASEFEQISERSGKSFKTVEIKCPSFENKATKLIGVIDKEFAGKIEQTIDKMGAKFDDIISDTVVRDYKILVYHINLHSRIGNAYSDRWGSDDADKRSSPKIRVKGDKEIASSSLTESLHNKVYVVVKGTSKRKGDMIKEIIIEDF